MGPRSSLPTTESIAHKVYSEAPTSEKTPAARQATPMRVSRRIPLCSARMSTKVATSTRRVYTHREELVENRHNPATLSLDGVLKVLSTPKDAPRSERPDTLEELEGRAGDTP
jgi:hypothetical protein